MQDQIGYEGDEKMKSHWKLLLWGIFAIIMGEIMSMFGIETFLITSFGVFIIGLLVLISDDVEQCFCKKQRKRK